MFALYVNVENIFTKVKINLIDNDKLQLKYYVFLVASVIKLKIIFIRVNKSGFILDCVA